MKNGKQEFCVFQLPFFLFYVFKLRFKKNCLHSTQDKMENMYVNSTSEISQIVQANLYKLKIVKKFLH